MGQLIRSGWAPLGALRLLGLGLGLKVDPCKHLTKVGKYSACFLRKRTAYLHRLDKFLQVLHIILLSQHEQV